MREYMFYDELKRLHDFMSLLVEKEFVIDGCDFFLVDFLGSPPKTLFLFQRKTHGYRISLNLFEVYEGAVSGRILPKDEALKDRLKDCLIAYPYLTKSQKRKIEEWS